MDTLETLKGVGPAAAQVLQAAGLTSFAQIAALGADELAARVEAAGGLKGNPDFAGIVEAAKAASRPLEGALQGDGAASPEVDTHPEAKASSGKAGGTGENEPAQERDASRPSVGGGADATLSHVRVTGPRKGRWRAGRHFNAEPRELTVTAAELAALAADPRLKVERVGD